MANSTKPKFSLKDHLFNKDSVARLADLFADADPSFDRAEFETAVMTAMPDLELKQRITMIADFLAAQLPHDFEEAAGVIGAALPPPLDSSLTDDDLGRVHHRSAW